MATTPYDVLAARYDAWFDTPAGRILFDDEVASLRRLWPTEPGPALEIGVGTGRFSQALGVDTGLDPAPGMLALARARGITAAAGRGESLPYADASWRTVLMVTVLGFTDDPAAVLREAARVLVPGGSLLLAEIPADSEWGRRCRQSRDEGDPFFQGLRQFSAGEISGLLSASGLEVRETYSTLVDSKPGAPCAEDPRMGLVPGAGFIVLRAVKPADGT